MLRARLRFPLGVYHARLGSEEAEWPPAPLRLIGALLAAAHERPGAEPEPDRALLQRLCEAPPPIVLAPASVAVGESAEGDEVVRLRGATRWVPRNYITGPVSPRNLGRDRAQVSKAGVAIGDRPVVIEWPEVELDHDDLQRLSILASEITFLGTTRSPVVVEIGDASDAERAYSGARAGEERAGEALNAWTPSSDDRVSPDAMLRVPDARAIAGFDRRHRARQSARPKVEKAGLVPELAIGTQMPYLYTRPRRPGTVDPRWWGAMIVLEIDQGRSELLPRAPAAYLLARAVRVMLLGAFGDAGTAEEAPAILRARGADPHCAIVPLPHVWGEHADGLIRGVAVIPPHVRRAPDVQTQIERLELGLRRCVEAQDGAGQRHVQVPGAGRIYLKLPDAASVRLPSLREDLYIRPARRWVSVTPIVHSRWRKGGADALLEQVRADCAHAGLPAPVEIELLRAPGRIGGADRALPPPPGHESWNGPLQGPTSHLRITFAEKVRGPVLLGRARHFGLGLCVPDDRSSTGARTS
ncbi:MAG: type I-G CRISPR-associated protein Csb2 [Solirubrobacteraceae bacterium]